MLTPVKNILSWFVPITLAKHSSELNPELIVKQFRGHLLLTTPFAIYSQGQTYRPFRKMFRLIKGDLKNVNTFLMLGTGLGSALKILQQTYECFPSATLVDIDEKILQLSHQYMNLNSRQNVSWRCDHAYNFLQQEDRRYDLIAIDIFKDLQMPDEIQSRLFMELCHQHLSDHGIICWNTIHAVENDATLFEQELYKVFTVKRYAVGLNVFYICRKS